MLMKWKVPIDMLKMNISMFISLWSLNLMNLSHSVVINNNFMVISSSVLGYMLAQCADQIAY